MIIKTIVDEDFVNYKVPSMYIGTAFCGGKCCIEAGIPISVCQNDGWRKASNIELDDHKIVERYLANSITHAICFAGLEPFEQFDEMYRLIAILRNEYNCTDPVIIYTGYNKDEIQSQVERLREFPNIIVKFGRYRPNGKAHFDEVLGVTLVSENQYAEKIS